MNRQIAFEPVDVDVTFDETLLNGGVDAYLAASEGGFSEITEGTQKRVVWAGDPEQKTALSVIYLHGFSATSEEIRPVPDRVAEALGANLYFTRLKGHGLGTEGMSTATAGDWVKDTAEALAIGRAIGEQVLVLSVSTGGTLAAVAATDPKMSQDVAGIVFIAPNFGVKHPVAATLTWPWARVWGPRLFGKMSGFEPANALHGKYWTAKYASVAVLPMLALVRKTLGLNFEKVGIPALFYFSPDDKIVKASRTEQIARKWGGETRILRIAGSDVDDPDNHVITGEIMSPRQTDPCIKAVLEWVGTLKLKR